MGDFTLGQTLAILFVTTLVVIGLAVGLSRLDGRIGKNPEESDTTMPGDK